MADINVNKIFTFYNEVAVNDSIKPFILDSEVIQFAVATVRDIAVFTDKRILIADKQGITGKKIEYYTIPYKNIITYAVETAGTLDIDSEIKLLLSGGVSVELRFMKDANMDQLLLKVYRLLTKFIFE